MRKAFVLVLITILFAGLTAAPASALPMVCFKLQHGILGVGPIVYKLSVEDMDNGNFSLMGSSYTTLVTNPPVTIRRVISGGAVVMDANAVEVSLRSTDMEDRPETTSVEGLAVSDIHLLLDSSLNGTFNIVNVQYPAPSDTTGSVVTRSHGGTVSLVDCNTPN